MNTILLYIIVIGVFLGISIPLIIKKRKEVQKLLNDGKIVQRDIHFAEKGEEFTSKIGSYQALSEALGKMELPCRMSGNTSKVEFTGRAFTAGLYRVDFDKPSGIAIYRFEFHSWKSYRGMYEQSNEMNMLMTSVEKAFLSLDPYTSVSNYAKNFKTKHSLF